MYNVSAAFHTAIANGAPQMAMFIFSDVVFSNSDIDVSKGINFSDYFNMEDDLAIGQTLSNEISFSVFNDDDLLNSYEFGEFCALLGVRISSTTANTGATVYAKVGSNTYKGFSSYPYLKRNDAAIGTQPSGPIRNIVIYDGVVHCFLRNGGYIAYKDSDGTVKSTSMNSFMKDKFSKMDNCGFYYNKSTRMLNIWQDGFKDQYEFCPLGYFTADRPDVPSKIEIDFTCYDRMQKFEKDMPSDADLREAYVAAYGGSYGYPLSFLTLLRAMCAYAEVPCGMNSFINSSATVSSRPSEFDNVTMRDVLKWIAEAAGGNARFNRDGQLTIAWLQSTSQVMDESNYTDFNPTWYETKKVTKLENRGTDGSYDHKTGSGDETYLIQDNPLLRGVTGT